MWNSGWCKVEVAGMEHPEAFALANAYVESLDRGKHGGEVDLGSADVQHLQRLVAVHGVRRRPDP